MSLRREHWFALQLFLHLRDLRGYVSPGTCLPCGFRSSIQMWASTHRAPRCRVHLAKFCIEGMVGRVVESGRAKSMQIGSNRQICHTGGHNTYLFDLRSRSPGPPPFIVDELDGCELHSSRRRRFAHPRSGNWKVTPFLRSRQLDSFRKNVAAMVSPLLLRRRTPGPPSFSSMNSTPAVSIATAEYPNGKFRIRARIYRFFPGALEGFFSNRTPIPPDSSSVN